MVLCQNCGSQQAGDAVYCEECGAKLQYPGAPYAGGAAKPDVPHPPTLPVMGPASSPQCASCGTKLEPGSVFCHMCGAPVSTPPAEGAGGARPAGTVMPTEVIQPKAAPVVALRVKETQAPVRIPEQQPVLVLGRNDPIGKVYPDIDLTPHGGATLGVSRRHARLFFDQGQLYIEDLQSTNLTRVNGDPVEPGNPRPLRSGDEVRLGRLSLMISIT